MKNTIVLKKVSLWIDRKPILKDISFIVMPNKPMCILGRGSSGKSSLLKTIIGILKPNSGYITINGVSTEDPEISEIYKRFGVVFQKDALFDSLSVWENIMFRSLDKKPKKKLLKRTFEILKMVGLEKNDAFLFPNQLSGGMRKRVAIARAISHKPEFLILDEPTAGLDPIKTNIIFKIIKKLSSSLDTTLIVVTSDMKSVMKYFKETVVLEDSQVYWKGDVRHLSSKKSSYLKNLFGSLIN